MRNIRQTVLMSTSTMLSLSHSFMLLFIQLSDVELRVPLLSSFAKVNSMKE